MNKRELHEAVNAEMRDAANKVATMETELKNLQESIEYWKRQEEAARTVSIRLDLEADREGI